MLGVRAKVMEGHTLADGLARLSHGLPGDLPRDGRRRRAVRATSTPCSSGLPTTPRTASSCAAERCSARCSTRCCCSSSASASCSSCWFTSCRRSSRCSKPARRELPFAHAGADRDQRFPAQLGHLSARRDRGRAVSVRALAHESRPTRRRLHRVPAARCRCSAGSCAASIPRASRARSASSPPAPCRCSRRCASRAKSSPTYRCATPSTDAAARVREGAPIGRSLGAEQAVSADDGPPDLERRIERRARRHARSRRRPTRNASWIRSCRASSGCWVR